MTALYRRHGSAPASLPRVAYDDDGQAWTDLANNAVGREACGFVLAPPKPAETWAQLVQWDAAAEQWAMVDRPPPPPPTGADVTAERNRRIDTPMTFDGVLYQCGAGDRENIAGAAQLAFQAMQEWPEEAAAGVYDWYVNPLTGEREAFGWIALDNTVVPMDAPTVKLFGEVAAYRKSAMTFAAKELKKVDPIPADYADDAYWPA